jgi:glycerol-3-phosphate acyltransferase PlsY
MNIDPSFATSLAAIIGYLLGSLSTAIITCRAMGLPDPRSSGSNNPGATNVLRTGSRKAAALTLAGDMLKGLIAILIARALSDESSVIAAAGLGAFLGHLYPLYFGFKGGKGVATALGALIGFSWISGLMAIATWLAMALTFRISSLSALTTFAAAPLYLWLVTSDQTLLGSMIAISVMLFWRHRSNIRDLLQGKEGRIGKRDNGK